jgi:hypothetical protein
MKHLLFLGLVLILTACGAPEASTPAPTPEAIQIIYPQALHPWVDKLANCATNIPQISLYFIESDALNTDIQVNTIALEFGQPNTISNNTYQSQVGWEQIVIVVNKENSLSKLSYEELKAIFSGQLSQSEIGTGLFNQVWVLPKGEPTRMLFDQVVIQKQPLTTDAMLAPDPGAMLEAISKNPDAVGYLPGSFLNTKDPSFSSKVKIVQLEPSLEAELRQPVIAITQAEPEGLLRNLLVCLDANSS